MPRGDRACGMRAAVALLVLAALAAGCSAPSEPVGVVLVNAPDLRDVVPRPEDLPEGFVVGWEQPYGMAHDAVDGLSRVYDHTRNEPPAHHSLRAGAMRFGSESAAREAFEQLATAGGMREATLVEPGIVVQVNEQGSPAEPERYVRNAVAFGHRGLYVVWMGEDARGEAPLTDSVELVREMLSRAHAS